MQTMAQSRIKAAFSALVETLNPKKHRISSIVHAKAHRIGPQRVILKIALNDNFNGLDIKHIAIAQQQLQFNLEAMKTENITVSLMAANDDLTACMDSNREHRSTLKVRRETKQLTLTFKHSNNDVYLTQKIQID